MVQGDSVVSIIPSVLTTLVTGFLVYLPQLLGGLIIFVVGLLVASTLKKLVYVAFRVLKIEHWLEEAKIGKGKTLRIWVDLFAELVRWSAVLLFLIPAVEMWGIPRFTSVLNQIISFIPNVFIAVIVGLFGAIAANFVSDIVAHGGKSIGSKQAKTLSSVSYYAIIFFTALVVLNQLGVASDLIRILFTGIVFMLSLAGGLAFGLGGKDMARDILADLRKKFK